MECTCETCDGKGEIECPECNGQGTYRGSISDITLEKSMLGYKELVELQKDARRVIRQAARLCELNPARQESYDAQLKATMSIINKQAEAVAKKPCTSKN